MTNRSDAHHSAVLLWHVCDSADAYKTPNCLTDLITYKISSSHICAFNFLIIISSGKGRIQEVVVKYNSWLPLMTFLVIIVFFLRTHPVFFSQPCSTTDGKAPKLWKKMRCRSSALKNRQVAEQIKLQCAQPYFDHWW